MWIARFLYACGVAMLATTPVGHSSARSVAVSSHRDMRDGNVAPPSLRFIPSGMPSSPAVANGIPITEAGLPISASSGMPSNIPISQDAQILPPAAAADQNGTVGSSSSGVPGSSTIASSSPPVSNSANNGIASQSIANMNNVAATSAQTVNTSTDAQPPLSEASASINNSTITTAATSMGNGTLTTATPPSPQGAATPQTNSTVITSSSSGLNPSNNLNLTTIAAVVGAEPTPEGEYLWMVSIHIDGRHWCGGMLLGTNAVLTAAHCLIASNGTRYNPQAIALYIGGTNQSELGAFRQKRKPASLHIHPGFNPYTFVYDAGVVIFAQAVTDIPPVQLFTGSDEQLFDMVHMARVLGWGATSNNGNLSDTLREASVRLLARSQCVTALDTDFTSGLEYCAGNLLQGGVDACRGDSGGPLFFLDPERDGAACVFGIVSHGKECGLPGYPGVYARIGSVLDWVRIKAESYSTTTDTARDQPSITNPCAPNPCANSGQCFVATSVSSSGRQQMQFVCKCSSSRWMGKTCSVRNYCSSKPCGQNGVCINGSNTYRCNCNRSWSGRNCTKRW